MLEQYIQIDNVLNSPDKLVEFALAQKFYSNKEHPYPPSNWRGFRTLALHDLDQNVFLSTFETIFKKSLLLSFGEKSENIKINYNVESYFHILPKQFKFSSDWIHKDECLYAGVIYLNPVGKYPGTRLYIGDNEKSMKNKFNRLIAYNSNILHAPISGSGDTLENSRLTLVFFINSLNFYI